MNSNKHHIQPCSRLLRGVRARLVTAVARTPLHHLQDVLQLLPNLSVTIRLGSKRLGKSSYFNSNFSSFFSIHLKSWSNFFFFDNIVYLYKFNVYKCYLTLTFNKYNFVTNVFYFVWQYVCRKCKEKVATLIDFYVLRRLRVYTKSL